MPPSLDISAARAIRLRLLRTHDMVDLRLSLYGATLTTVDGERRLRTRARGGILVVTLPPQHLGEQAFPETPNSPTPTGQASLRIAETSRLAYDLPADLDIAASAAEVLALIPLLPLRTVPLATPAPVEDPPRLTFPGGLLDRRIGHRLRADRAARLEGLVDQASPPRGRGRSAVLRAATGSRLLRRRRPGDDLVVFPPGGPIIRPPVGPRGIPRPPEPLETAIEAPFRLVVSPSAEHGAFRHAVEPVTSPDDADRTEVWRTTLTSRVVDDDDPDLVIGHDDGPGQRIVRAVWARDLDPDLQPEGFLSSLDPPIRRTIVRMSAQTSEGVTPRPLQVRRLALSSLGAWIDWRGDWSDTWEHYPDGPDDWFMVLESYTHQAAMGRDTYVRVTQPGFLFPFGHRAVWVTVTERKIAPEGPAIAYLRQRYFIVLREQTRTYPGRDTPLQQVTLSPTTTPDLDRPPGLPDDAITLTDQFIPSRGGTPFLWDIDALDAAGNPASFSAPLLFVPANALPDLTDLEISIAYSPIANIPARGQSVSLAPSEAHGDTAFETAVLTFDGVVDRSDFRSRPYLAQANVVVPAMRHLAPASPTVVVSYTDAYLQHGFSDDNPAQMFLGLTTQAPVDFSDGSDRAGGFIEPSLQVRGLSRTLGASGQTGDESGGLSQGEFDPDAFLAGAMPKLFGLFSLLEILDLAGLDLELAPDFVSEALDAISSIESEGRRLRDALDGGLQRLAADLGTAAHAGAEAQVQQALDQLEAAAAPALDELTALIDLLANLLGHPETAADIAARITALLGTLPGLLDAIANPMLPAAVRATIERPTLALRAITDDPALDVLKALTEFANEILSPSGSVTARYEWRPQITSWPETGDKAVFVADDPRGLSIGVEVRASASGAPSADVVAELRSFALQLLPGEPMMRMNFSRIGFRVGTGRKPEVDVVFDGMEFLGVLGFIDTLRRMIPFDGFADPPYVDISPAGVTAGFDLALPNVSVGVFSLENISLGADVRVPFLGDAVTVGFYFCRKDSPFRLTVMCIGGGGWVGLRASPAGLVELEMGLEAAAALSIDLGVASGSVSIAVGVYLRLEGDAGSLTAYFRIRGEVDVLGLISASITLELSLTYDFPTGKLIGRASVVVEVEVLFFSASVEVSCERRLAGSKGDPTLADIMPPGEGGEEAWAQYCAAFAEVGS